MRNAIIVSRVVIICTPIGIKNTAGHNWKTTICGLIHRKLENWFHYRKSISKITGKKRNPVRRCVYNCVYTYTAIWDYYNADNLLLLLPFHRGYDPLLIFHQFLLHFSLTVIKVAFLLNISLTRFWPLCSVDGSLVYYNVRIKCLKFSHHVGRKTRNSVMIMLLRSVSTL